MKKAIFAALVAATTMALAISCQKEETGNSEIVESTPIVNITFADSGHSKAFFDNTSTAESFEKEISSLSILVFDEDEQLVVRRNFTEQEILEKSCTFRLPKTVAGSTCFFHAIANFSVSDVKTIEELRALLENDIASYNGTFAEVTTAAKREGGFVMSGVKTKEVEESGQTDVSITLKRSVAKIALQTTVSDSFSTLYGGKLTVLSATVGSGAESTTVLPRENSIETTWEYSHTQQVSTSEGKSNSLFYIYENEYCSNRKPATMSILVRYDIDGDEGTTSDQREFSYDFDLKGKGDGIICRNGYYRIAANILGPEGNDCEVSVEVADWVTPQTQEIDLGI